MQGGRAAGLCAMLALLLAAGPARAYAQSDAPLLDDRVEAAWASSDVQEGQQWQAFLRLKPGSNVTAVGYQACIVPGACIIPPTAATRLDAQTWGMDTADYVSPLNGKPYPWPAGTVGVKWFLATGGANFTEGRQLPTGLDASDPACSDPAVCMQSHYLTLPVAAVASQGAPAPGAALALLAVALAGWLRRG